MAYVGFAQYGLRIVAAFDKDDGKVGQQIAGCTVRGTRGMRPFIKRHRIRLAILTVPAAEAQQVAERLVGAGIKAIWNFSPVRLTVPRGVFVRNEHISLGLSELAFHLRDDI
jgi:redox-sensing transcriptional repressor